MWTGFSREAHNSQSGDYWEISLVIHHEPRFLCSYWRSSRREAHQLHFWKQGHFPRCLTDWGIKLLHTQDPFRMRVETCWAQQCWPRCATLRKSPSERERLNLPYHVPSLDNHVSSFLDGVQCGGEELNFLILDYRSATVWPWQILNVIVSDFSSLKWVWSWQVWCYCDV